ncbi:GntR family transcriptional regulator [Aquicoccus sp. SU-CL01552]|uniref:GntR family transcriptional regulator n=1 Tax=Aquicoccus sp. SU-CL01552 TaxID=3127656 RepID=UPI003103152F
MPTRTTSDTAGEEPKRLHEQALAQMRADILSLALAPGEAVSERNLETRYGVSRTLIRQALATLIQEGLVQRITRSYVVAPFDVQELVELFEFREEVEVSAVRLVCERATPEQLDALQATVDRGLEELEPEDWLGSGLDIHVELAELSGNRYLREAVRDAARRALRARWLLASDPGEREVAHREHSEIIAHVRHGDVDKAVTAIRAHTRAVRDQILGAIGEARRYLGARSFADDPDDAIRHPRKDA